MNQPLKPKHVPNPGLYLYNNDDQNGSKSVICQVTDTHVKFHPDYNGLTHDQVPKAITFTPLTLENVPVLQRALVISYQNTPIVTINLPDSQHTPNTILDDYATQYAMDRKYLSAAITPYIPLPKQEN